MTRSYAEIRKRMDLRNQALIANGTDLGHLEVKRARLDELLTEAGSLTARQASLESQKQEVSKRLAELMKEATSLLAFLDSGVKQQYGTRSEKLVEFGLQPFRGRPRIPAEPEGKPKPSPAEKETPPAAPEAS